jgi:hypothetical protein
MWGVYVVSTTCAGAQAVQHLPQRVNKLEPREFARACTPTEES